MFPFLAWFERRYKGRYKFDRFVFGLDLMLIGSTITLVALSIILLLFPPKQFSDKIFFNALVAPKEIVTGASSTLVIRFTNGTNEVLRRSHIQFAYPDHFLLQTIRYNKTDVIGSEIDLGEIPVAGSGEIHIKGVMFGDVGGTQTFTSTLLFVHGQKVDIADQKISASVFSPTRSALVLEVATPDRVISGEPMRATISIFNTGPVNFPEIDIKPVWPKNFAFTKSSASMRQGTFHLSAIKTGSRAAVTFDGVLADTTDPLEFRFDSSFTFGKDTYQQETITKTVPVIPPPLSIEQTLKTKSVRPGSNITFTIAYKNIQTFPLENIELGIETDNPFLKEATTKKIKRLEPGASGETQITIPVRPHVAQSELSTFENIHISTRAFAHYTLSDGTNANATTHSRELILNLTTPITLESFARYTTPDGDQIGRGPLPPRVGRTTSYWIFFHVNGTTNALDHAVIEGTLPMGVVFTGKQTASENSGVAFDPTTRRVTWSADSVPPTFSPSSKIYGVAFEVTLTPTGQQVGTAPLLIKYIQLTGTDASTGEWITASSSNLTTNLQSDKMATGKGVVK